MIESSMIHSICYLPYEDYKIHGLKNFFRVSAKCAVSWQAMFLHISSRFLNKCWREENVNFFIFMSFVFIIYVIHILHELL